MAPLTEPAAGATHKCACRLGSHSQSPPGSSGFTGDKSLKSVFPVAAAGLPLFCSSVIDPLSSGSPSGALPQSYDPSHVLHRLWAQRWDCVCVGGGPRCPAALRMSRHPFCSGFEQSSCRLWVLEMTIQEDAHSQLGPYTQRVTEGRGGAVIASVSGPKKHTSAFVLSRKDMG